MKNSALFGASFLVWLGGIVAAQNQGAANEAAQFVKKLPAETRALSQQERRQIPSTANVEAWREFTAKTGEWVVEWNPTTGNPHRAYGGNARIAGFRSQSAGEVDRVARQFLVDHAAMLKLDEKQLQLRRADQILNKWYVTYRQVKDGIPVLFSEVELRLSSSGNVMMFGSDFHPEIQVNTTSSLSSQAAFEAATRGMQVTEVIPPAETASQLYVLPVENEDRLDYHLAYRFETITSSPFGRFVTYVDAHSGEVLWRFNRVRYSVTGNVSGAVHRNNATDPLTSLFFPDLTLALGSQSITTDASGNFRFNNVGADLTLTAALEGNFARVTRADGAAASFTATVQDGQQLNILWDAGNSQTSERDAYFHTNIAHAFIKSVDPNFTGVDYAMPVRVNLNQTCNAFWDGNGINFFRAGGGCRNTAEIPTVVYHEYGHGINDKQYLQQGIEDGLTNIAMHEGLADINAALLVDDPIVGRGFMENGGYVRNVKNTNRYPQDLSGEVHNDGLILAGALWDMREALGLEIARRYSHFARYGSPDDPDLLTAYNEYFIEVLIVDDNDGTLANLTPNFVAINQAFSAHGIGAASLLRIAHEERGDAAGSENDYLVQAQVSTVAFIGVDPNAATVHFSTDGQNFLSIPMAASAGANFRARLPRQMPGSVVSYYFTAHDNLGASLTFPAGAPQSKAFSFLVGFRSRRLDDFESNQPWKISDATDTATTGVWERVDPNGTSIGSVQVQPEHDHSPAGVNCFVTGNAPAAGTPGVNDVDGGKTTLYSPVFDLTPYKNPLIRYYRWYTNNAGNSPGLDDWEVHISNDSGKTWVEVERTRETDNSWRKVFFFVQKFLPPTSKVQLRFVAQDQNPGSLVEAALDDFEILEAETVTEVATFAESPLPTDLRLHTSYPNPFRIGAANGGAAVTMIRYELPKLTPVRVAVYDLNGRLVRVLQEGPQTAGAHALVWNGADAAGNLASSGFYFVVLEAERRKLSRKILVVK
ncbi:T9SS type A sorting domain-containing protein [candidate division KSB1 bacterium]|nr:T9SS type A sorting domain-containing protein [candidate division KSB1 bacterium]